MEAGSDGRNETGLGLYLREIGRRSVPTREEEAELSRRIRDGDERALDELVSRNLRFVVSVARRYRGRGLSLSDLVNEGNVGMIRAARRFDGERGVRFVTYASWWIRQAILEALARRDSAEPPPAGPTARTGARLSLDAADPGGASLAERTADPRAESPDAPTHRRALRRAIARSLTSLPRREAEVLRLYFGLDDGEARTLGAIARRMEVSRSRVRQLRDRALRRLRSGPAGMVLASFFDGRAEPDPEIC